MTSLYTGYRNVYQPQFNIQQENKEREEKVRERELRDNKPSFVASEEKAKDMDAFLAKLQKNRKNLLQNADQRQQMQDEIAKRKLALSNAIQMSKLASYESTNQRVQQEIKGLVQQLAQLLAAQAELEQAENKATESSISLAISAAVKKARLRQQTMLTPVIEKLVQESTPHTRSAPVNAEVMQQDTAENPQRRSAPTESAESTTQTKSTRAATYADDITTIGQDKMTPEEQIWHDLSVLLATISEIEDILKEINALMKDLLDSDSGFHHENLRTRFGILYKRMTRAMEVINKYEVNGDNIYLQPPAGMTSEELKSLLDKAGIKCGVNDSTGEVYIKGFKASAFSQISQKLWDANYHLAHGSGSYINAYRDFQAASKYSTEFLTESELKQQIAAINSYYPKPELPESDDSTLSGWLAGMLPAFDSIDKSNINFYKSLIALITSWQSKINDFNKLYSEILKKSGGVNSEDGKHRFDISSTDKLLAMLDDISALEQQMALILGGVNSTDLQNLLEGTGINVTEVIGTVAMVDLGMDITQMMRDAVKGLQSHIWQNDYLVTPEQLTHFNSTLTQVQTQFDIIIKKVNTKTESAKSLFNDTKEALSNLLKTAESLLADLAKMIR